MNNCIKSLRLTRILASRFLSTQSNVKEVSTVSEGIREENKQNMLSHQDYFEVSKMFTVEDLYKSRVHFGHKLGSLDDRMKPYLYGERLGHAIFDLDKTAEHLRTALNIIAHIAYKDGIILWFLRSPQNSHIVEKSAQECNEFAHTRVWRGGVFTNANIQFDAVTRLPDLCIFLSTLNTVLMQHVAVRDSAKMLIPTIAVVDSNCNPNLVTYPVPGNDDSPVAVKFYCSVFKQAILKGKEVRKKHIEEGIYSHLQ